MEFRTELSQNISQWKIDLKDPVLTVGSCFAESIGHQFFANKFQTLTNPFGTTYHPASIHKILNYVVFKESPPLHTYLEKEGIFYNYDFHSGFSEVSEERLQNRLNESIGMLHNFLKKCNVLILTYGTAWIYERTDTGDPVANCHKLPAALFTKRLSGIDDILNSFRNTYTQIKSLQPDLHIILTVSPVRHLKDSLPLNAVSKSILRVACHQISQAYADVDYFPAYEIMLDDLRDYRFYKDDLIHPNATAERYIWEKFKSIYFSPSTLAFLKQWGDIQNALAHRPFHPDSNVHQKFLRETLSRLEELKSIANVDNEINLVIQQLH